MRVLIGCEKSGVIRRAFRARGHDAWSCDMEPAQDSQECHLLGDVLHFANRETWDLFIVHPPCTFVCVSGMHWTTRGLRDPQFTVKAIKFAEDCFDVNIAKLCLENPISVLSTRSKLQKPTQIIQPYYFGEDASKKTCLWLEGLMPLQGTKFIEPKLICPKCKWRNDYSAAFGHGCVQTILGSDSVSPLQ